MNDIQRGVLTMIRSAVTGQAQTLPENFSLEEAEKLIIKHQIVGLAYEGAVLCGLPKTHPVMNRLFQLYCQIVMRSNAQMNAVDKLLAVFEEKGIDYLPVKGCEIKRLYPRPAMRVMTDADVLIRMEQYEQIRAIVTDLGYTEGEIADHALVWNSKILELELHRRLVPTTDEDYYSYIGEGWQRAKHIRGHRYELSAEDAYIFLFVHFTKHYRDGGIGLRQAVDLWVYDRTHPNMDRAYLKQELEKLHLVEFYENTRQLLKAWFDGAELTEKLAFISQFIFDSGSWGTSEQRAVFAGYRNVKKAGSVKGGYWRTVLHSVFPSSREMGKRYPVLRKAPWLLPVMWPVRWVTAVLFRRENIRASANGLSKVTAEHVETFEQSLKYVGLDYRVQR